MKRRRRDQPLNWASAGRAGLHRVLGNLLNKIEVSAFLAKILVRWHTPLPLVPLTSILQFLGLAGELLDINFERFDINCELFNPAVFVGADLF